MSSAVQLVSCSIMENRHVTIHEHLMMMKVSASWVPGDLMPKQKERRVQNCLELLTVHRTPEGLFARRVCLSAPEVKRHLSCFH
jgi:hypothetical protein